MYKGYASSISVFTFLVFWAYFCYYHLMQAIILAAGKGTRMAPLTDHTPKPMLTVGDKNLLEWKLEALPKEITSVIFVVGYKKEVIKNHFGNMWKHLPITYVEHEQLDGTGGAITLCKEHILDRALIMMGDDIYTKEDLEKLVVHEFSILVEDQKERSLQSQGGKVVQKNGLLAGLNEGLSQMGIASTLVNTGAYTISKQYFNYPSVKFSETEYGLPHTLVSFCHIIPIHVVQATEWIQVTTPACLEKAEERLRKRV